MKEENSGRKRDVKVKSYANHRHIDYIRLDSTQIHDNTVHSLFENVRGLEENWISRSESATSYSMGNNICSLHLVFYAFWAISSKRKNLAFPSRRWQNMAKKNEHRRFFLYRSSGSHSIFVNKNKNEMHFSLCLLNIYSIFFACIDMFWLRDRVFRSLGSISLPLSIFRDVYVRMSIFRILLMVLFILNEVVALIDFYLVADGKFGHIYSSQTRFVDWMHTVEWIPTPLNFQKWRKSLRPSDI